MRYTLLVAHIASGALSVVRSAHGHGNIAFPDLAQYATMIDAREFKTQRLVLTVRNKLPG